LSGPAWKNISNSIAIEGIDLNIKYTTFMMFYKIKKKGQDTTEKERKELRSFTSYGWI